MPELVLLLPALTLSHRAAPDNPLHTSEPEPARLSRGDITLPRTTQLLAMEALEIPVLHVGE